MDKRLEELGQMFSSAAEAVGSKAEEAVKVTKIKRDIHTLKSANIQDFQEIGKLIYNRYLNDEVLDSVIMDICDTISNREDNIKEKRGDLSNIRGEKLCPVCGKYYSEDMVFCPYCGEKVSE